MMLEFTVCPQGHPNLHVEIYPDESRVVTNVQVDSCTAKGMKMCRKCAKSKTTNTCNLLDALVPILVYFSDILSYETVLIEYKNENCFVQCVESAQKAGFVVCIYAMFHSSCEFFSQFNFLLKYYKVNITYEIFMHLVLTTSLLQRQLDLNEVHEKIDIFSEVRMMMQEFRERLVCILDDARSLQHKDAAVNALNIIFSLNNLSAYHLKEYYKEVVGQIGAIRARI